MNEEMKDLLDLLSAMKGEPVTVAQKHPYASRENAFGDATVELITRTSWTRVTSRRWDGDGHPTESHSVLSSEEGGVSVNLAERSTLGDDLTDWRVNAEHPFFR